MFSGFCEDALPVQLVLGEHDAPVFPIRVNNQVLSFGIFLEDRAGRAAGNQRAVPFPSQAF